MQHPPSYLLIMLPEHFLHLPPHTLPLCTPGQIPGSTRAHPFVSTLLLLTKSLVKRWLIK